MPFRLLRLTTVYSQLVEQFLRANADYARLSYQALYDRFLQTRFAESNYHTEHLKQLGHEADTRFASVEPLQKQWAREHAVQFDPRNWLADIAVAQVKAFQPDVLLLDDLYAFDQPVRRRMVEVCRHRPLLLGWRAATTKDFSQFRDLDLVLSSIQGLVEQFRQAGVRAELLHHGFEASLLDLNPVCDRNFAFTFAGGLTSHHAERALLVEYLLNCTPLEVFCTEGPIRLKDRIRWLAGRLGFPQKQSARMRTLVWQYPDQVHPAVFGRDYYGLLARSKIVLNSHISCSPTDASNMRLYEATGMGACLLTDRKSNLKELFEPDVEVATYGCAEECAEKVCSLLANEHERRAIAEAGQRRTLSQHTIGSRAESLADLISHSLIRRAA